MAADQVDPIAVEEVDYLILGAGLTGLAAAQRLGNRATVLEQDDRPGGLVRTECFGGYWFDRVLHLLYFADPDTEVRIRRLLGEELVPCTPEAWVETGAGLVRYPYQLHLGGLDPETIIRCVRTLAEVTFAPPAGEPANFEDLLLRSFGSGMCEDFLFPYNRKMWKRPLASLAPAGFTWNITRPDFDQVLRGVLAGNKTFLAYNAKGWYPRPSPDAPQRGMELVARALARQVPDLRLNHRVEGIDPLRHEVVVRCHDRLQIFRYREGCLSTLPLPIALTLCNAVPEALALACRQLTRNRVLMAFLSIRGPRPQGRGHWRYYGDEGLIFNRLIYMHEFDPHSAPAEGWGLMAEITQRAEDEFDPAEVMLSRVREDVGRVGALPGDCRIIDAHLRVVDPAYVVFTVENQRVIDTARAFLEQHHIKPLGRYGRWEYSSMAQVMRDGFAWAEELLAAEEPQRVPSRSH